MSRLSYLFGGLLGLVLCAGPLRAEGPPSPLRLVPADTDLVLQAKSPRQLVETVLTIDYIKDLQKLGAYKEVLDSTQLRRFMQMVAWFERELGASWPELLDRLGGGGAVLATKLGDNSPALLVVQGTDEKALHKFATLLLRVIEQEMERQGVKERPAKGTYKDVPTVRIGKDFQAALVQGALLISNKEKTLHRALDLAAGREKKSLADNPDLADSARLLPKGTLASLWLNMEPVRKQPGGEALYKTPRDPFLTVTFGGAADIAGRSRYLCVGLVPDKTGVLATLRFPAGRIGMGPEQGLVCPPEGQPGSRPLLEPPGVLFSSSFYWDLAVLWNDRVKLFGAEHAKNMEQFDQNSGLVLSNFRFSKLVNQLGAYHRVVAVHQPNRGYKKQAKTPLPAFALVTEMRKPDEFSKAMETILRGVALFTGSQFGLRLSEEKHKGCNLVAYRFPEDRELKADVNDIRFNFSPSFVRVGNQFVFSSTQELARDLIDVLQAQAKGTDKGAAPTERSRIYPEGGVATLKSFEDQFITQTVLNTAVPVEEARAQLRQLIDLLSKTGGVSVETTYTPKEFHADLRLRFTK
jgi:hypothetical protein